MQLFINTQASDLASAAVTSASDFTALSEIPQVVLGDTETLIAKFLSAAGTYESWSGSGSYTLTAAIGLPTSNGVELYVLSSSFSTVANGWSGPLAFTTTEIVNAVATSIANCPRQGGLRATLQLIVTDASGLRETYAALPIFIRARVYAVGTDAPTPATSYPTTAEANALYLQKGQNLADLTSASTARSNLGLVIGTDILARAAGSYNASANSTGNTTITPAAGKLVHTEVITFTGSAGTRIVILDTTGRTAGDVVLVQLVLPATASIVVQLRNATSGGTLLASVTTDGTAGTVGLGTTYNGTAFGEPWFGAWVD